MRDVNACAASDEFGTTRRILLKAAACLLDYPDCRLDELLAELACDLQQMDGEAASLLVAAVRALREQSPAAREATYVATFDFAESCTLYLTAHELGDSRRRGEALVALRALLRTTGFAELEHELPDYLPMLLELIASAPGGPEIGQLESRLAVACARVRDKLPAASLYRCVFDALGLLLPNIGETEPRQEQPGGTRGARRWWIPLRETADTENLPYPLRYE